MPSSPRDTPQIDDDAGLPEEFKGPRFSQSLWRGLAMLRCFSSKEPVLGLADVAERLGMSRSTTHRYMTTLVELGYLEQTRDRKYRLGLRPLDIGMSALRATGLRDIGHLYLDRLRYDTGLTAGLAVLSGGSVLYVDRVQGKDVDMGIDGSPTIRTGVRLPAHCTSVGKILLAHLPEETRRHVLAEIVLTKHTRQTVTRRKQLEEQLTQIATRGFAVSDEELYSDMHSIAVPVRKGETVVAALDLTTNDEAVTTGALIQVYAPLLKDMARRMSLVLEV